jgi:formylglycine-generating enzyme required for sulfatase activity
MKLATPSLLAAAAAVVGTAAMRPEPAAEPPPFVETVAMPAAAFGYRMPGEYLAASGPVDAPVRTMVLSRGLEIMKYQVSAADYGRCVADGMCEPVASLSGSAELPVTGVNYQDARNYAAWLSRETGAVWRLPTDAEWTYAAGERFKDEALGPVGDAGDFAARWLSRYRLEAGAAAPDPGAEAARHVRHQ